MLEPRYGIWLPVAGNHGAMDHPDSPRDASYARSKSLIQLAESCGFTTTLIAQHLCNFRDANFEQLETWTAAAALAEATQTIEIIAAIKPLLFHPVVLAKMALGIDAISQGRFAINLISAWFKPELEKTGIPFLPHDERYRYSAEWLHVVKQLWSGKRVSFQGDYFHITDLNLLPRPIAQPHPRIYLGGESDPAQALAATTADVFFLNGRPIDEIRQLINRVSRLQRPVDRFSGQTHPRPLRFGLSAFVIARPTAAEAQQELEYLFSLIQQEDNTEFRQGIDPNAVMFQQMAKYPAVGGNGGTAAGLVGSYDQVAERIAEFFQIGIDTFMLQFQPYEVEVPRFAAEIMPRVQRITTSLPSNRSPLQQEPTARSDA
jgi:alkanesulfonate monooxygenase